MQKIFTGMSEGPEAIQANFTEVNNSFKFGAGTAAKLLNGVTGFLKYRATDTFFEIGGTVKIPDPSKGGFDIASFPANLAYGTFGAVFFGSGHGKTIYQLEFNNMGGTIKLFSQVTNNSSDDGSISIHEIFFFFIL